MVHPAVDGNKVGVPSVFGQGGGAYGCARSHCGVLEQALTDGVERLLVFEDDAVWTEMFGEGLADFLDCVPDDWDQLMIGGQHHRSPKKVNEYVVRCTNCQRTHCYAVRPKAQKSLLELWRTCRVHIDWVMGDWHREFVAYAPTEFLVGQGGGRSDISGRINGFMSWNRRKAEDETITLVRGTRDAVKPYRTQYHFGFWCDPVSGYDNGLREIVTQADPVPELRKWIILLKNEAQKIESRVAIWHPEITLEAVKQATSLPVVELDV